MKLLSQTRIVLLVSIFILASLPCTANTDMYNEARSLQHSGRFDEAIEVYKSYLTHQTDDELTSEQVSIYTDALVQLMNTFQSKGEPEACVSALVEIFEASPTLQDECLRDYYSVLGYALSRTENMDKAEETTLKAFSLPLFLATPERYFRDYAYAAAVFYSNPNYQKEVIQWCLEALQQAKLSENSSGQQWVTTMLGSLYKRNGDMNRAIELFLQSIEESHNNGDDLGVLNSLNALIDLFLYWNIPEYANLYATDALSVEQNMAMKNPMVSAQTYINKARALYQLGKTDSLSFYAEQARILCESLPYNSGMVDVNLLNGIYLTEIGGESLDPGINELRMVTSIGTATNRAKAYHQLGLTYLKHGQNKNAEIMLDSLYSLLNQSDSPSQILRLDYEPILNHYLKQKNQVKIEQYTRLLLEEQEAFKEHKLNYNLLEALVSLQTGKITQELKITRLSQTNNRLWFLICLIASLSIISVIAILLFFQRKRYKIKIKQNDTKLIDLTQKLNQSNEEKEKITQEVNEFLNFRENRQELVTLTPFILKEDGEIKFREHFELLYPLFLHRLREKVPSVTRREELLSMLIVLKQDNKQIAELLAIAPRSVLMLRHRFRQKIGMTTEYSLENFIAELLA